MPQEILYKLYYHVPLPLVSRFVQPKLEVENTLEMEENELGLFSLLTPPLLGCCELAVFLYQKPQFLSDCSFLTAVCPSYGHSSLPLPLQSWGWQWLHTPGSTTILQYALLISLNAAQPLWTASVLNSPQWPCLNEPSFSCYPTGALTYTSINRLIWGKKHSSLLGPKYRSRDQWLIDCLFLFVLSALLSPHSNSSSQSWKSTICTLILAQTLSFGSINFSLKYHLTFLSWMSVEFPLPSLQNGLSTCFHLWLPRLTILPFLPVNRTPVLCWFEALVYSEKMVPDGEMDHYWPSPAIAISFLSSSDYLKW